jgi:hypothetical protein
MNNEASALRETAEGATKSYHRSGWARRIGKDMFR